MARPLAFDRQEMIQRAMYAFWEKGFAATSIQDLVKATGLNRSSLYNTFKSKEQLFLLSLDQYTKVNSQLAQAKVKAAKDELDVIRIYLQAIMESSLADEQNKGCMIANCKAEVSNTQTEIKDWLTANQKFSMQFFSDLIERGQEKDIINQQSSPAEYAHFINSCLHGMRVVMKVQMSPELVNATINNMLRVLQR